MALFNINELNNKIPPDRFSLFALGFRPFFLMAGLAAILLMGGWLLLLTPVTGFETYYGPALWHGHEMVFGFAAAVIAGFLLTAARNWTNVETLKGSALAGLVLLWLAGRLFALLPTLLPSWLIAVVDLAFIPLLAVALAMPILRTDKKPQLIFVALLMLMFVANLLVHLVILDIIAISAELGVRLAVNAVLVIIVVMAGRVLPLFIERGAPGSQPRKWPWLEKAAPLSMVALLLVELLQLDPRLIAVVAVVAAIVNGLRLWGWYSHRVWQVPLLWVLVLGYGWLVLGFIMTAAAMLGLIVESFALHAFAAAISVLSLGMMARVALGHTGRLLQPARAMTWAFVLLNIAMFLRVFASLIFPAAVNVLIFFAGFLVSVAFVIFVAVYLPILSKARIDGRPG